MGNKSIILDLGINFTAHIIIPLRNWLRYGTPKMFSSIALETTSWCNRSCEYCPSGKYKREKRRLETELVHKVLNELGELRFDGTIYLHLFNEPLYDKRLPDLVRYAREKCPGSKISISSNGDNLDPAIMKRLIEAGLDLLFITQYDGKVNDNVRATQESIDRGENHKLQVRVQNAFESNRAGSIESLKINEMLKKPCYRPGRMMVINANGKVLLCCNDYFGKEILGDVSAEKLIDCWRSKRFQFLRKKLSNSDRTVSELCKACNEITPKENKIEDLAKTKTYRVLKKLGLI